MLMNRNFLMELHGLQLKLTYLASLPNTMLFLRTRQFFFSSIHSVSPSRFTSHSGARRLKFWSSTAKSRARRSWRSTSFFTSTVS